MTNAPVFSAVPQSKGSLLPRNLICFSHLRWNFVYQRPQHLLSRAARHYTVFFFEEPAFEDIPAAVLRSSVSEEGVTVLVPVIPSSASSSGSARIQRALLDAFLEDLGNPRHIAWYYTPAAIKFSAHLAPALCVYDNMDELSAFRGASPELLALESALLAKADLVFTGGMSLFEAKKHRHRNIHAYPSSIDAAHFAKARTPQPAPKDQAAIPRPRLGFFGVIDERMNLELVAEIAAARPSWQLVMIGPVVKIDPATLPRRPNIHWLGSKDYRDLPAYLAGWDLGLMPFALNEATRFISPTKTPEFLAAGLQVVSTPIADVVRPYGERRLVEIADDAADFIAAAERLLRGTPDTWRQDVDRHLASQSWDRTWDSMHAHILSGLNVRVRDKPIAARPLVLTAATGEAHV